MKTVELAIANDYDLVKDRVLFRISAVVREYEMAEAPFHLVSQTLLQGATHSAHSNFQNPSLDDTINLLINLAVELEKLK